MAFVANMPDLTAIIADIATNAGDIATNAGDIATNAGDIATNAGDITTLSGSIAGKVSLTISGAEVYSGNSPTSWTDLDLSGTIGATASVVVLSVVPQEAWSTGKYWAFRRNGDTKEYLIAQHGGARAIGYGLNAVGTIVTLATDSSGIVEWNAGEAKSVKVYLEAYIN